LGNLVPGSTTGIVEIGEDGTPLYVPIVKRRRGRPR
jgi:hypothetical protein